MKLHKGEQGQAIVEMALVLPILLLLLFGIIEMGRVGYAYITVNNAARAAVRVATTGATDSEIQGAVKDAAPTFSETELTIVINPIEANRQSGQSVLVTVSYPVHLISPIIRDLLPDPFIVNSALSMRVE